MRPQTNRVHQMTRPSGLQPRSTGNQNTSRSASTAVASTFAHGGRGTSRRWFSSTAVGRCWRRYSGWWDHIGPFFSATHRVIAPDLSGHGDSGTRPKYQFHTWADEIVEVANSFVVQGDLIIIGHSMGGLVAAKAAPRHGNRLDSIVIIDSPLGDDAPEQLRLRERSRRTTAYRTKEDIISRFVPVPGQDSVLPYIGRHIANQSIRRTLRRWSWKFDPAVFDAPLLDLGGGDQEFMECALAEMPCRIGYLRCESGLVPPNMADRIRSVLQLRGPFVELPLSGHHPMLDQPVGLVASLRTLLEMWSII